MPEAPARNRNREEEIERLATQTGRLIREAEPGARTELVEAASAILREEALMAQSPETSSQIRSRKPVNPLAAGLGIFVVGAGMALLFPLIGIALMTCGVLAVVWGAIISARRA